MLWDSWACGFDPMNSKPAGIMVCSLTLVASICEVLVRVIRNSVALPKTKTDGHCCSNVIEGAIQVVADTPFAIVSLTVGQQSLGLIKLIEIVLFPGPVSYTHLTLPTKA